MRNHATKHGGSYMVKTQIAPKLILVEDIWDSIALDSSKLPLPEWQKKELAKRYNEYNQGKLELHDWQDVHNKLREKHE